VVGCIVNLVGREARRWSFRKKAADIVVVLLRAAVAKARNRSVVLLNKDVMMGSLVVEQVASMTVGLDEDEGRAVERRKYVL
ncbi:hypothetical protein RYX36_008359, partial [Vicia faba]